MKSIIQPEPKLLTECKGMVVSDYQKVLEDEWLGTLKASNKVVIAQTTLKALKETWK